MGKADRTQEELCHEDLLALSIRLPFPITKWAKDESPKCRRCAQICEHRDRAAEMLKRTAESETWFVKAHEQDVLHRTQLGTLGYLPVEVRLYIWHWLVLDLRACRHWRLATQENLITNLVGIGSEFFNLGYLSAYSHDFYGNRSYTVNNRTHRMLEVSYDLAAEMQATLFLQYRIAFQEPEAWTLFAQTIKANSRQSFAFHFRLYNSDGSRKSEICTGAWIGALAWLPPNTRCVTFELGKFVGTPKAELRLLDILNKRVVRNAPRAVRRLAEFHDREPRELPPKRRQEIEEILADIEL